MSETPVTESMVVESIPSAVMGVWSRILSKLEAGSFSQEDVFAVNLALQEAFINAIKHGNKMERNKQVKIEYLVGLDKVEISVSDEGQGFDPNSVPDPRYGENLYKTEGRGLFLIRSYMSLLEFNEEGNVLHMVRYKGQPDVVKNPGASIPGKS